MTHTGITKTSFLPVDSNLFKSQHYSHVHKYDLVTTLPNFINYIVPVDKKVFGEITVSDIKQYSIGVLEKEICLAHFSMVKIREMEINDAGAVLRIAINKAIYDIGYGIDPDDILKVTQIVCKDVLRDYSFMTVEEVAIAFRMGAREEFGELRGINVRQFYVWLRKYNQLMKKQAIERLRFVVKPKENIPTDIEKEKIRKDWLNAWCIMYDEWAEGKDVLLIDANNIFYNYCFKNKILVLTPEENKELYKQAELLFKLKHGAKNAKSKGERVDFDTILKKLQKGDVTIKKMVISEAKNLSIKLFFRRLKESKKTLRSIISEIEK